MFAGLGRQECSKALPCQQLPVYYKSEAIYLHNAHETRRWLESNPVQSGWLYPKSIRHQLRWDFASANPRKLPHTKGLLLRQTVFRRWASCWVQTFPAHPKQGSAITFCQSVIFVHTSNHCRFDSLSSSLQKNQFYGVNVRGIHIKLRAPRVKFEHW